MLNHHFRQQQDFYIILYNEYIDNNHTQNTKQNIVFVENIRKYWRENKKDWFSHKPINNDNMNVNIIPYDIHSPNINFSLILQYDQLSRHPVEIQHEQQEDNKYTRGDLLYIKYVSSEPIKNINYRFATHMALNMIHNDVQYNSLETHEKIFTLLCIRHNNNLRLKYFVLSKIHGELERITPDTAVTEPQYKEWLRFLNATVLDINEWKILNNIFNNHENIIYNEEQQNNYLKNAYDVIELRSGEKTVQDKIIINYIKNVTIEMENLILSNHNKRHNDIQNDIQNKSTNRIAISISGGVDSMVASYILSQVCKKNDLEMIMLHICYNNRVCCDKELQLLYYWASKLGCKLYVRHIDELTRERNTQYRALYEDITRKIRFSFYKYFECPIILGHNRDDTFENMFSNLSKNIHFDNLKGMKNATVESNVLLLRPFINVNKRDIINISIHLKIPNLIDSTPVWSRRGKTRDTLMPLIEEFDNRILPGLEKMTEYTTFLYNQWDISFNKWLLSDKIERKYTRCSTVPIQYDNSNLCIDITVTRDEFFNTNYKQYMFWIRLWFGLELASRPSNKSINNIINSIDRLKYPIHSTVNKDFMMIIDENTIRIVDVVTLMC